MEEFDAIILGSGQGGNPLAKKLSKEGLRVALVESGFIGGTCVNDGCTPTKTLVGMAKDISLASRAGKYGATVNRDTVDYRSISHRKNEVVHYFRKGLEDSLIQDLNIKLFYGKGSFSGYKKLRVLSKNVDSTTITAKKIFINTGARARIPDINGLQSVKFFTSRTLLELDCLPKHLLIIGGGHHGRNYLRPAAGHGLSRPVFRSQAHCRGSDAFRKLKRPWPRVNLIRKTWRKKEYLRSGDGFGLRSPAGSW
jgi:pyruvate/2-oxoglutarate dehydrogenase complex dihydrolipoamide dehydrogenase (E3) component